MKKRNTSVLFVMLLLVTGLAGYASHADAAHPSSVTLKDASGAEITLNSYIPYSPKQTCGVGACHNYESDVALATKDHGDATASYQVPYPQHGVTAGYHFQQGRNLDWGKTQRDFFHQATFTSSGGMWGKY